jgi:hypothetical protein
MGLNENHRMILHARTFYPKKETRRIATVLLAPMNDILNFSVHRDTMIFHFFNHTPQQLYFRTTYSHATSKFLMKISVAVSKPTVESCPVH